ncbi:hypothetical protein A4A49_14908 [Nicotiana attenuata]|uniref:Uncharacterized protein n=1 Tax=Nicotiana attenuata TaxID=49451 RepID=A0A314KYV2_NICAT|nr:hypothetical protein A4A49_14908 [Nicotiana attenuata]
MEESKQASTMLEEPENQGEDVVEGVKEEEKKSENLIDVGADDIVGTTDTGMKGIIVHSEELGGKYVNAGVEAPGAPGQQPGSSVVGEDVEDGEENAKKSTKEVQEPGSLVTDKEKLSSLGI